MSRKKRKLIAKPTPGYDGKVEHGMMIVADPYEPGSKTEVAVNKRHDLLLWWRSRNLIDEAQLVAGRRFQGLCERARVGGTCALDPSTPLVDRSLPIDLISEKALHAFQQLRVLVPILGHRDYNYLYRVISEGDCLTNISLFDGGSKWDREYVSLRIRDALDILAVHWGAKGRARLSITAYRDEKLAS